MKQLESEILKLNGSLKAEKALNKSLAEENNQLKSDLNISQNKVADLQEQLKVALKTSSKASFEKSGSQTSQLPLTYTYPFS